MLKQLLDGLKQWALRLTAPSRVHYINGPEILPPHGVRLLSCDTATGGDLLPAVQAQRLRICLGNRALLCGQVTVAFAGKNLSDGRYLALFGPGLAGQARRYGRGKTRKQSCAGRAGGPPPKSSEPAQEGRISC